jgi:hypothetical protein
LPWHSTSDLWVQARLQLQQQDSTSQLSKTKSQLQVMTDRVQAMELERQALQRALCSKAQDVQRLELASADQRQKSTEEQHHLRCALQAKLHDVSQSSQSSDSALRTQLLDARRCTMESEEALREQRCEIRRLQQALERSDQQRTHMDNTISGMLVVNGDLHSQVLQVDLLMCEQICLFWYRLST